MQLSHAMTSLLCDFCDLNHMGDLIDHPTDGRRIIVNHRLLMPFDAQSFQGSPVLLQATNPAPDLLDGDFLLSILLSHGAPPKIPRGHHARRRPVPPSPVAPDRQLWPERR